jgi:hypothetical protein
MSSIYRDDRSPFWTACFTAYFGQQAKQLKKTTGTADKELAKLIAVKLEEAGRGALNVEKAKGVPGDMPGLRTERAARRAFDDVLRLITGTGLESRTTRSFVEWWKERTRGEVAPASLLVGGREAMGRASENAAARDPQSRLQKIPRTQKDDYSIARAVTSFFLLGNASCACRRAIRPASPPDAEEANSLQLKHVLHSVRTIRAPHYVVNQSRRRLE